MNGGGPGRLKLECGVAINRSATRLPISFGELPAGHFRNSFGCSCACSDSATSIIETANNSVVVLRDRFIMSPLFFVIETKKSGTPVLTPGVSTARTYQRRRLQKSQL